MGYIFNGTTDLISTPSITPGTAFSLYARVKPSALAAGVIVGFQKTGGTPDCVFMSLKGTNTFGAGSKWGTTNGAWKAADGTVATTGVWYSLGVTYNWVTTADDPVLYFAGQSAGVTETSTPSGTKDATVTNPFTIGNKNDASNGLTGIIGEVAAWSVIKTAVEMADIDALGPLASPENLLFYYDLTTSPNDMSGNARNGTVTGATPSEHMFRPGRRG